MWSRIRFLIVKELLATLRDPKARIILIVPPLIQMLVFTFAATQEVKNVPIAVYNPDRGHPARDLVARLTGSRNFSRVLHLKSEAEIRRVIDAQEALMVVRLGLDFSRNVLAGQPASVQLILDARRANSAQIVALYAQSIVDRYDAELRRGASVAAGAPSMSMSMSMSPSASRAVTLDSRVWFNSNLDSTYSTVPALVGILSTLIGLMVTGLSVAREREVGTFDQLLVSPLSPTEILVGKSLPALLIGLVLVTGQLLIGVFIIGVPFRGSLPLLYLSITLFLASIIGVGLLVSSLAHTQQQAVLYAFSIMVPATLLSGFATPVQNMPDWLQTLSWANPLRHFIAILRGLFLKDPPAHEILVQLFPLVVIGAVTLSVSSWLFRRKLE